MHRAPARPKLDDVVETLRSNLAIRVESADLELEWRDWRWMALLPNHVVWAASSDEAWVRLERGAALTRAARMGAGRSIPEILLEDPNVRIQVLERMSGVHGEDIEARIFGVDPSELPLAIRFLPQCPLTSWGETFAGDLGRLLARLHRAMPMGFGLELGLTTYPIDFDEIGRVLHEHVGLDVLNRVLPQLRAWAESIPAPDVVVHGDPHFHNMFASEHGRLTGLIDFEDAAVGDRHHDLRYLHSQGPRFARAAIDAYATEAGTAVDEQTAARFHVWSAFHHFAFIEPDAPRFSKIISWAVEAAMALAPEWTR